MLTIEEMQRTFQQEALDKLWLGKPVVMRWRDGTLHTGTVLVLRAANRSAYVRGERGEEWEQTIDTLHLVPEPEPLPRRWFHKLLDPLFDRQGVK